jgi:hypothetical protein
MPRYAKHLLIACLFTFGLPSVHAGALADEVTQLKAQFERANATNARQMVQQLNWSGIQDETMYDIVEVKLRESYLDRDRDRIEYSSWLVKGLAVSGLTKYDAIMQEIAASDAHGKLKKHNKKAIERLKDYVTWAPIIGKDLDSATTASELRIMRVNNLLTSGHSELIREGAKIVYRDLPIDQAMQDQVEQVLLATHDKPADRVHVDAMAWLCKSLAQSGDPKYAATLQEIAANTPEKKLRKHAAKYAKSLQ